MWSSSEACSVSVFFWLTAVREPRCFHISLTLTHIGLSESHNDNSLVHDLHGHACSDMAGTRLIIANTNPVFLPVFWAVPVMMPVTSHSHPSSSATPSDNVSGHNPSTTFRWIWGQRDQSWWASPQCVRPYFAMAANWQYNTTEFLLLFSLVSLISSFGS